MIAGLMTIGCEPKPRELQTKALANLQSLTDLQIVLLDKLAGKQLPRLQVAEVIQLMHEQSWHDTANRFALMSRALAYPAKWLVWLDDDETFEPKVDYKVLTDLIREAAQSGCQAIEFQLCEMWDEDHYRVDGVWGQKRKVRVHVNPLLADMVHWRQNHTHRYHTVPLPVCDVHQSNLRILHWGMSTPELRKVRLAKWTQLDPDNKFGNYGYFADETGMELKSV
jgi:hypothetical protein